MLTLRIIKGRDCGLSRTVGRAEFVIGRSSTCDWVLPDASRHLSGQHCRIAWMDGHHVLTDTSANGVFHNHANEPVGRGHSVFLSDGDTLTLGDYIFEVTQGRAPEERQAQPCWGDGSFQDEAAAPDTMGAALFATGDGGVFQPAAKATPDDHVPFLHGFFPSEATRAQEAPPAGPAAEPASTASVPANWWQQIGAGDAGLPINDSAEPPTPAPDHAEPTAPMPPPAADESALLLEFLEAAGLSPADVDGGDPAAIMRVAGATYRRTVEGLCGLLSMRSSLKAEFRIDRTVIASHGNNPLKFSTDTGQTARLLLLPSQPGYLPADEAVGQSFRDIQQHELAASVGMQSALASLLRRFDPEALKERLDRQPILASFVPAARRARYWELYEALYQEIATEAENDFQSLFGREFAQAYECQIRALSDAAPPADPAADPAAPVQGETH